MCGLKTPQNLISMVENCWTQEEHWETGSKELQNTLTEGFEPVMKGGSTESAWSRLGWGLRPLPLRWCLDRYGSGPNPRQPPWENRIGQCTLRAPELPESMLLPRMPHVPEQSPQACHGPLFRKTARSRTCDSLAQACRRSSARFYCVEEPNPDTDWKEHGRDGGVLAEEHIRQTHGGVVRRFRDWTKIQERALLGPRDEQERQHDADSEAYRVPVSRSGDETPTPMPQREFPIAHDLRSFVPGTAALPKYLKKKPPDHTSKCRDDWCCACVSRKNAVHGHLYASPKATSWGM